MIDTTIQEKAKLGQLSSPASTQDIPAGSVAPQSNNKVSNVVLDANGIPTINYSNGGKVVGNTPISQDQLTTYGSTVQDPNGYLKKNGQSTQSGPQTPIPSLQTSTSPQPMSPAAASPQGTVPGQISTVAQATAAGAYDATHGPGSYAQKYQTALSNAKASGVAAPQSPGDGSAGIKDNLPAPAAPQYDSTKADTVLADNQAHQQYVSDYTQSQSSPAQTETLTQTYQDLTDKLGIPALDTQLMNMKNIIDGTEQDIRDEVTKAGGFATNSQVLAMTDARNKTMIQNYNNLLQTRDDAEKNLSTMMDLTEKDRDYARQKINDQLNFDQQNIQYADKALSNAQDAYKTMQSSEGWDGIYKAAVATGDPQAIQKINSTMGPGFDLVTMAKQDAITRGQNTQKTNLEIEQAGLNIQKTKADIAAANEKTNEDNGVPIPAKANQPGFDSTGVKLNPTSASQQILSQFKTSGVFDKNGAVPPANYNQAKAWWVEQGLSATEFDSIMGQYKTDQTNKQYN